MDHRIKESKYLTIGIVLLVVLLVGVLVIFRSMFFMKSYQNKANHFAIKYPGSWIKEENFGGAAVVFKSPLESGLDTFSENVNVVVQDATQARMSLEKYTETALLQIRMSFKENIEMVESRGDFLNGKPAYRFVYIGRGDIEFKIMHVWTIVGDRAYQITYTSLLSYYDQYIHQVEKMIKSFRVQ